jgi:hypothetical protein
VTRRSTFAPFRIPTFVAAIEQHWRPVVVRHVIGAVIATAWALQPSPSFRATCKLGSTERSRRRSMVKCSLAVLLDLACPLLPASVKLSTFAILGSEFRSCLRTTNEPMDSASSVTNTYGDGMQRHAISRSCG